MSTYNDAWFMNESLAFYLSTSTFINPLFDSMVQDESDQSAGIAAAPARDQPDARLSLATNKSRAPPTKHNRCIDFYDNLAFTFRSKMYVLKLDFKRILERLRRFTDKRMPCWLLSKPSFGSATRPAAALGISGGGGHEGAQAVDFGGASDQMEADYGGGANGNGNRFWLNNVEPNSRESLCLQKVKILSRLEQAIEEKRNNNNKQQQQQQLLFNMTDHVGLPFVRPIGSTRGSQPTSSSSLSSACSSSLSGGSGSGSGSSSSSASTSRINRISGHPSNWSANKRFRPRRWNFGGAAAAGQQLPQEPQVDGSSNKKLCVICYTNLPNIVTLPCKHHEICSDCFIELIYNAVKHSQYPLKCVLCRQKIEKIRCSRGLLLSVIKKNRIVP